MTKTEFSRRPNPVSARLHYITSTKLLSLGTLGLWNEYGTEWNIYFVTNAYITVLFDAYWLDKLFKGTFLLVKNRSCLPAFRCFDAACFGWCWQVMRIDITSLNTADNSRTVIDSAVNVKFSPLNVKQILVTTTANKLLKFDARNGRILAEV